MVLIGSVINSYAINSVIASHVFNNYNTTAVNIHEIQMKRFSLSLI